MKSLKDYEKEINKCSKCGLCESVCPIFKINHNECSVSKGKFIMLHGVAKGDLKLSENINKYIDTCLKCEKCTEFCPAGIDAVQIFNTAKYEYEKNNISAKFIYFLQSKFIFSKFISFIKGINNILFFQKNKKSSETKLIYFKGCVNNILPNTDRFLRKIFKNKPLNIIEPNFECCGLPFLSEGNMEEFERVAKYNIDLLDQDCKYIVTDCASCESTLRNYSKYIHKTTNYNVINWGEFIAKENMKFMYNKPVKITFHKPCHLKNDKFIKKLFNNCINIRYVEMEDYDNCCGCSGSFILKNRKLSKTLSKNKAVNIAKTNADYVITTCPACIIGIKQGLHIIKNKNTKVISLLEFLSMADEILY